MEKVKYVLKIWTKLSTHVRARDRSIKILQYGCQMLLGYYGSKFSKEVTEGLRRTKFLASTSRKAFWLLKSFNHVGTVITMIETYSLEADECYANLLDILEQLFLILYYFYENLVFVSRTQLTWLKEDMIDDWGNWSWFMEDFVCFLAALMRTYISRRNLVGRQMVLRDGHAGADLIPAHNGKAYPPTTGPTGPTDLAMAGSPQLSIEVSSRSLKKLQRAYSDSLLTLAIAVFELGASAEAVDLFRMLFGAPIGDTGMGLCGVVSSSLILYEYGLAAVRADEVEEQEETINKETEGNGQREETVAPAAPCCATVQNGSAVPS